METPVACQGHCQSQELCRKKAKVTWFWCILAKLPIVQSHLSTGMHIWWCPLGCPQGEKSLPAPWLRSSWWSHTLCIWFTYLYIHLYRYLCISWCKGDRFTLHMPKTLLILETPVAIHREERIVAKCGNQPRGAQSNWNQTIKVLCQINITEVCRDERTTSSPSQRKGIKEGGG